jgi:hypothetical protein
MWSFSTPYSAVLPINTSIWVEPRFIAKKLYLKCLYSLEWRVWNICGTAVGFLYRFPWVWAHDVEVLKIFVALFLSLYDNLLWTRTFLSEDRWESNKVWRIQSKITSLTTKFGRTSFCPARFLCHVSGSPDEILSTFWNRKHGNTCLNSLWRVIYE